MPLTRLCALVLSPFSKTKKRYGSVVALASALLAGTPMGAHGQISRLSTITTVAGNGSTTYNGASGAATSINLWAPGAIVADNSGILYIADTNNGLVRRVDPFSGALTTIAGKRSGSTPADGDPATSGNLGTIHGIALDGSGSLYIAADNRIWKVNLAAGTITRTAGDGVASYNGDGIAATAAEVNQPWNLVVDSSGNLYFADEGNNRIRRIDAVTKTITTVAGTGASGISTNGAVATASAINAPVGVAINPSGNICFTESASVYCIVAGNLSRVAGTGGNTYNGDGIVATSASLRFPYGIGFDTSGNLYIGDQANQRVRRVDAVSQLISTVVGDGTAASSGDGGFPTDAEVNKPVSVALDPFGNIYVSENGAARIRKIEAATGNAPLPAASVGSTSTRIVPIQLTATQTVNSISAATSQGGVQEYTVGTVTGCTLAASNATGSICSVPITFSPAYPGRRDVTLTVSTNTGTYTVGLTGYATAPQAVFNTVMQSTLDVGLRENFGIAVDASGNLYSADTSHAAIKKIPVGCTTAACVITLGGGFSGPLDVALDAAGYVILSDPSSGGIRRMPVDCISSACVTTMGGGFGYVQGITVDHNGYVYVADNGGSIKRMPPDCTSAACVTTLGGGFTLPMGVAVANSGTVYMTDYSTGKVNKIPSDCASASCVSAVVSGYPNPYRITVDAAENVYFSDTGSTLRFIPAGCTSSSCVVNLGSGLNAGGIALDSTGNIYIAGLSARTIIKLGRTSTSLSFADTAVNSTSSDSPKTATLTNIGNSTLSFPAPTTGQNPSVAANFALDNSGTCPVLSSASPAGSLTSGSSCTLAAKFIPTVPGAITGSITITDDSLNASPATTQVIALGGTGIAAHKYFDVAGPDPITSYTNQSLTITARNTDGSIDTTYSGTLALTSTDPGFVYGGCSISLGIASCNVGLKAAGTQSVTATDTVDVARTGTFTTTVVPGPMVGYGITVPSSAVARVPISATVYARDLYGNVVTSYSGSVHFTSSDSAATLPADSTLSAGTGTFNNITFRTAGSQTITATDTVTTTLTTTSNPVTVTPLNLVVTVATDASVSNATHCTAQIMPGSGTDSNCSLRDALAFASSVGGGNISFDGTAFATAKTITLTGTLNLSANITIQGATSGSGASLKNLVTIAGKYPSQMFSVFTVGGANDQLRNLVITKGGSSLGGGVENFGALTLFQCTITFNTASNGGGGIYHQGSALLLDGTTISGNSAQNGAGIFALGPLTIRSSTVSGNTAIGTISIAGGGIYTSAALTIESSTVSNNIAMTTDPTGIANGGGIFVHSGTTTLTNSIVGANVIASPAGTAADIFGVYTNNGGNISSNSASPISASSNLKLSALGSYGGPVQTLVPLPGSPAICSALAANIPSGITADQRGYARTATYGTTTCVDSGATQSSYSIAFTKQPSTVVQNTAMSPSPTVSISEQGNVFTPATSTVVLSHSGSGTISGNSTAAVNGVATYSALKLNTAQTADKLTATLNLNSTNTLAATDTSNAFDVTSAVSKLAFVTAPASSITAGGNAGNAISVQEQDASGTLVNTATDTITITVTGPNSYSKTYNSVAVAGVATFDLSTDSLTAAGSYSYTASLTGATSANASTTVSSTSAATISIVSGSAQSATIGGAFGAPLVVKVVDAYSNPVSGATVTFTAPSTGASAALSTPSTTAADGTTSSIATANGVASGTAYAVSASVTGVAAPANFSLTNNKAATTLSVAPITATSIYGQPVSITATVTPTAIGGSSPTGTVSFSEGATVLTPASAVSGASASYLANVPSVGSHTYSAQYAGDTNFQASAIATASTALVVNKASSTIVTTVSNDTISYGTGTTYTVSVQGQFSGNTVAVPSGNLTYTIGAGSPQTVALVAPASPLGLPTATITIPAAQAVGPYAITINYAGDGNYKPATAATINLTVGKAAATLALGGLSATYDGTAHVATASTTPGGLNVSFTYNGSATAPAAAGTYAVVATINDGSYQGSATGTLIIAKATPTITWATPSSITYGTALSSTQLNATASTNGTFSYTPGVGVILQSGTNQTLSTTFTPADTADFNTATKQVTITVGKQAASITLVPSAASVNPFQPVVLTATVSPSVNGSPSGAVTFMDGSTVLQTVTLTGATATYSVTLSPGSHSLSATYSGDTNYLAASTSTNATVTVLPLEFTLNATTSSYQTVQPGGTASFGYSINPTYGVFPGTVTFAVAGLPSGATYTITPATFAPTAGQQLVTLNITVPASTASFKSAKSQLTMLALLLMPLGGIRRLRRASRTMQRLVMLAALACAGLAATGCGAGNGFLAHAPHDYAVTVTATSGALAHTSTVTLNVQ